MLNNIQVLRAFAALAVALSHLATYHPALTVLGLGTIGVEVFFVISGFIMVHITQARPTSPKRFLASRIARVVPLYWVMTLSVFAVAAVTPELLGSTRADLSQLFKSLLFIPFVKHGTVVQPLLFQGWTLNLEMLFYALFAGGLMITGAAPRVAVISFFLAAAVLAGQLLSPLSLIAAFYTSPLLLCFAFGMGFGLVYPRIGPGLAGASVLAFATLIVVNGWGDIGAGLIACQRIAFALAVVALALMLESWGIVLARPFLLLLGSASYALYLSHPFVSIAIELIARRLGLLDGSWLPAVLMFAIAAMIGAAVAVHRLIELPLDRVARRLLAAPHLQAATR